MRADAFARIGENHVSWNVLCLGMSSSIHSLACTGSLHGCTSARAGPLACATRALRRSRLVFCVLTCCVLYCPTAPHDPSLDVLSLDVVVCRAAIGREPALAPRGPAAAGLVRTCIPSDMRSPHCLAPCPTAGDAIGAASGSDRTQSRSPVDLSPDSTPPDTAKRVPLARSAP